MDSLRIGGYVVALFCAVIAVAHAPGLTHHLHWKATLGWRFKRQANRVRT